MNHVSTNIAFILCEYWGGGAVHFFVTDGDAAQRSGQGTVGQPSSTLPKGPRRGPTEHHGRKNTFPSCLSQNNHYLCKNLIFKLEHQETTF